MESNKIEVRKENLFRGIKLNLEIEFIRKLKRILMLNYFRNGIQF